MAIALKMMDAAWFYLEKPNAPAHFGPLIIMTPPKNAPETFIRDLVAEWRGFQKFSPPFNYQLAKGSIPRWNVLPDDKVDLEYHLRHSALPAPGGEKELGELVSRLHSHPLDRLKPLWECHIIEGLENGRFALYLKLHHGQLDGMGAVKLIHRAFSSSSRTRNMVPPWCIGMTGGDQKARKKPRKISLVSEETTPKKTLFSKWRKTMSVMPEVALTATSFIANAYGGLTPELVAPFQAPMTILNGRIHAQRRYATQRYALDRVKRIADHANVKLNDVFLAICGGALRKYLIEQDALPSKPLIGQVPMNIRAEGDSSIGNAISFMYTTLGTNIEDPLERLSAVEASSTAAKYVQEGLPSDGVEPFTMLMTGPYISEVILGLGGYVPPAANLVISNLRGPRKHLYFNGARVEQIYGPSVLFHGQALNITLSTYADEVNIGFTGCRDSLPSMQKLAVYTGEALEELEQLVS